MYQQKWPLPCQPDELHNIQDIEALLDCMHTVHPNTGSLTGAWPCLIFALTSDKFPVQKVYMCGKCDEMINRKISMIFPLVSCCSCVNNPSSS